MSFYIPVVILRPYCELIPIVLKDRLRRYHVTMRSICMERNMTEYNAMEDYRCGLKGKLFEARLPR